MSIWQESIVNVWKWDGPSNATVMVMMDEPSSSVRLPISGRGAA